VYCRLTNRLAYITYSLKKDAGPTSTKRINMYISFTNYQTGTFNDSVFSTDPFFTVKSTSDIQLAQGMDPAYEIVNFLEESPNINSNNINNDIQ